MSVLETPRLLFRGQVTWDPIVTNNLDIWYNEKTARTVFDNNADVAQYRQQAIGNVTAAPPNTNWNPDGSHRAVFFETTVIGADKGQGPELGDPILGVPVSLTGMLVDAEPYGSFSSQLFFDRMSFGIDGGCQIALPRKTRMTARYINFFRNLTYHVIAGRASVVWQTAFDKTDPGFKLHNPSDLSPVLGKFVQALADDDVTGLSLRWVAYRTLYYDSKDPSNLSTRAKELQAKLKAGGFQPNPARSELVGVLGLQRRREPTSEPGDRALVPVAWTKKIDNVPPPNPIATAHVRLVENSLVFDLSNSMPEADITLEKQDFGTLHAVLVNGQSVVAPLGTIPYTEYNKSAYERNAGIITMAIEPYWAMMAGFCDIQLRLDDQTVALTERPLRAVPMVPNDYIDVGETATIQARVYDRGKPVGENVSVNLYPASMTMSATARTNAQGIVSFPIQGTRGQVEQYLFSPGGVPLPASFDQQQTTYVYIRTLPLDADVGRLRPTWANLYGHVLKNWQALAPCMDNWLNLGDPSQVKSFGPLLKKLTAKGNFESFLFMPVTRDITVGERTLLYAFLDSPDIDGSLMATQDVLERPISNDAMSRAMRKA